MGNGVSQRNLEPGDIIYIRVNSRSVAYHYGIYVGNGKVVHFDEREGIRKSNYKHFTIDKSVRKDDKMRTLPREEVVESAEYYLNNPGRIGKYNLDTNNSEHFVRLCATKHRDTYQLQTVVVTTAKIAARVAGYGDVVDTVVGALSEMGYINIPNTN